MIPSEPHGPRARHRSPRRRRRARGRRPSRRAQPRRCRRRGSRARRSARASRTRRGVAHPRRRAALPALGARAAAGAQQGARPPRDGAGARDARPRRRDRARTRRSRRSPSYASIRRRRSARCPAITSSCAGSSRRRPAARRSAAAGSSACSPRRRARASSTPQTVAALASARLDQRIALDVKTRRVRRASASTISCAGSVCRPSELAAPLATLVAAGELLRDRRALPARATRSPSSSSRSAQLVGTADGALARGAAHAAAGRAARTRATTRSSPASRSAALVATDGDRVRKSAAPKTPTLSPVERRCSRSSRRPGIEPPRPKELPAALGLAEPQVKTALDKPGRREARDQGEARSRHAREDRRRRPRHGSSRSSTQHGTIDAQQWKDLTGAIAQVHDPARRVLRRREAHAARRRRAAKALDGKLAQLALQDLAGRSCAAARRGTSPCAGACSRRGPRGSSRSTSVSVSVLAVAQHDERAQRLAPLGIGHADHRGLEDRRDACCR